MTEPQKKTPKKGRDDSEKDGVARPVTLPKVCRVCGYRPHLSNCGLMQYSE